MRGEHGGQLSANQSSPGGQHRLVVLPLGRLAELHGHVGLDAEVHGPERDLHLADSVVLGEGVLVVHLEHDRLLPHVVRGQLRKNIWF